MRESAGRRLVRYGWYPAVLFLSTASAGWMLQSGASPALVIAAVSLVLIPTCLAMELACPESSRWRLERGEVFADFLHMVISNPVPTAIFRALFFTAIVGLSDRLTSAIGFGLWPTAWPLAAQAALAIAVAELANYWIHRGLHRSRLWPLHAVHHCSPRMYALISVRKHPLQTLITYGGRLSVLWLLGATDEAIALYSILISANSFLQHSNVAMTTGPLGWIFATPELHRLHHSSRPDELDNNYGDSLIVWDRLFDTFRLPDPSRELHAHIGLPGLEVSQTYASHWKLPFAWARLHAEAGERTGDAV
jgi:sterol desaturase/sphingolipid hydroxylase (fatty acid hydroxylase superfamily)